MMEPFDINMESFIGEIRDEPAIWNTGCEAYSNRTEKTRAWEKICEMFCNNFQELGPSEKNQIAAVFQRKWKSLRDSYNREVKTMRKVASGKVAAKKKKYIYFDQLSFLQTLGHRESASGRQDADENSSSEAPDNAHLAEGTPPSKKAKQIKRNVPMEDEAIRVHHQERIVKKQIDRRTLSKDDDTLFFLSLVNDFKKISDDLKCDAKCEILQVLKNYKRLSSPDYANSSQKTTQYSSNYSVPDPRGAFPPSNHPQTHFASRPQPSSKYASTYIPSGLTVAQPNPVPGHSQTKTNVNIKTERPDTPPVTFTYHCYSVESDDSEDSEITDLF